MVIKKLDDKDGQIAVIFILNFIEYLIQKYMTGMIQSDPSKTIDKNRFSFSR